jgi:hypothetical protein
MKSQLVGQRLPSFIDLESELCLPLGQSKSQLHKEFADIRKNFHGRYVRLYGACDKKGFYDNIVDAAWDNGLGVHALIWVSILRSLDYVITSIIQFCSSGLMEEPFGKPVEIVFLLLFIPTLRPNSSLGLFNSAPSLCSTTFCHTPSLPLR